MVDAVHGPVAPMSDAAAAAFPAADYVIAVVLPRDAQGVPIEGPPAVTVHASSALTIAAETDLAGMETAPAGAQLLPKPGEILKITAPDESVTYCTNVPVWKWIALRFTGLE